MTTLDTFNLIKIEEFSQNTLAFTTKTSHQLLSSWSYLNLSELPGKKGNYCIYLEITLAWSPVLVSTAPTPYSLTMSFDCRPIASVFNRNLCLKYIRIWPLSTIVEVVLFLSTQKNQRYTSKWFKKRLKKIKSLKSCLIVIKEEFCRPAVHSFLILFYLCSFWLDS